MSGHEIEETGNGSLSDESKRALLLKLLKEQQLQEKRHQIEEAKVDGLVEESKKRKPLLRLHKKEPPQPEPAESGENVEKTFAAQPEVAIIGISCKFAGAGNADQFWDNLAAGVSSIGEVSELRWSSERYYDEDPRAEGKTNCKWGGFIDGADLFDPLFFNISPLEAENMDPQQRLVLEHAWKAFDDAGYGRERLDSANCGIFVGVMNNDYVQRLTNEFPTQEMMGRSNAILAARISFLLNLKGPAMTLDTACSSSLVALHLARRSILDGETDMMLAGGVTLYINPESYIMMGKAGMLSPNGRCIAFDAKSNGFVPGEGVGMLLLKRLDRALEDGDHVYGVIKGSGTNQDGKTNGITAPNPAAQEALQLEVFKRSGVDPETVSMVETHGTSTPLGDPIEVEALRASFSKYTERENYCALGAVKNNIGHASAAAGVAGVIKVLKAMENAQIPAVAGFERLNERIELEGSPFYIPTTTQAWQADEGARRRATVSSYGFSGTNSFVILEEAPPSQCRSGAGQVADYCAIALAAKSAELLKESVRFLADALKRRSLTSRGVTLQDVANTLYYEKDHERFRVCFLVQGEAELFRAIEEFLAGKIPVCDAGASDDRRRAASRESQSRLARESLALQVFTNDFQTRRLTKEDYLRFVAQYQRGTDGKPGVESRPVYQRVPLPIVAFDRQSYWIGRPAKVRALSTQTSIVTLRAQASYLRDHVVNGLPTLSATTYLDFIGQAQGHELCPVRYDNIEWLQLIQIAERPIDLEVSRENNGRTETYSFRVKGGRGGAAARLRLEEDPAMATDSVPVAARDIRQFQQTAGFVFERGEIEQFFAQNGIRYGESFDYLERVHRRGDELLGELRSRGPVSFSGMLDAALRTAGLFHCHDSSMQRIPVAIASITQTASIAEATYAHVSKRGASLFDIDVLDERGQTIVKVESLRLAEKLRLLPPVFYRPGDVELPTTTTHGAAEETTRATVFVVAGGEGIAQALKQISSVRVLAEHRVDDEASGAPTIPDVTEAATVYVVIGGEPREREHLINQQMFVLTLARQLQALGSARQKRNLVLLTRAATMGSQGIAVDELAAAFIGLARVIANEFSTLNVVHFDLAAEEEYGQQHQALLRAISAGRIKNAALKTYRLSDGVVRPAITLPVALAPAKTSVFRQGGTYLIVGGARGIGYELALYLAGRYRAKLVLAGRREADDAIARNLRKIEAVGGVARYYACDVTSAADLREKVARPEAAIGPIHGVVNSALVSNDRSITRMERGHFAATFDSKFLTCQALYGVFGNAALDFMLFFSSTQSFVGNPGQANYGAGSTFMDAYAHNRNVAAAFPVKTINWGYWGSVGSVASREMNERLRSTYGSESLDVWEGMEAIERVLASEHQQIIVAKPGPGGGVAMGLVEGERQQAAAQSTTVSYKGSVKEQLKRIVGKALRIAPEELDETMPFTDYGLDSLIGVSLANDLNDVFDTGLNPTAFFDYINVRQLALHIEKARENRTHSRGDAQEPFNGEAERPSTQAAEAAQDPHTADENQGRVTGERQQAAAQSTTVSHKGSVKERLKEIVGKALRIAPEKLEETMPFTDYGLDSLVGVSLANDLNDVFDTGLTPTAFFDYINVRQLALHIEKELGKSTHSQGDVHVLFNGKAEGSSIQAAEVDQAPIAADENLFDDVFDLDTTEAAVVLPRPGTIGQIKIKPLQVRDPKPNEIQVKVHAFSLNFGDLLCVKGFYPTMPPYPFTPGFEASGTIVRVGEGVSDFRPGDEVIAMFGDGLGGHSTLVTTTTDYVVPKPANISHENASAFGVVFVTMAHAFERAQVKPGESVLIQSAAGGVGLVAVQMAQRAGAKIYATAGSNIKLDYLRQMGVNDPINYRTEDFKQKVLELTHGRGLDVVINTLGGEAVQKGLDVLAPGGRYVEIAPVALKSGQGFNLSRLTDNQTLISIDMRRLMLRDKAAARRYLRQMCEALLEQTVVPTVGATYPLANIREAYRYLESRESIGKVVVRNPGVKDAPLLSAEAARKRFEAHPSGASLAATLKSPAGQQKVPGTPIAIIGMSGRFAGAPDLNSFWRNLAQGVSSISEIPANRWQLAGFFDHDQEAPNRSYGKWGGFLEDIDQFDPIFFGLSGKEVALMDPQQRLFLETSWNALDHAGYANDRIGGANCSVFVGVGESEYKWRMEAAAVEKQAQAFWSNEASVLAARLSYFLDLKGASIAVNTACSSSLVAVDLACKSLASGESEMAIAGGVSVLNHPSFFILASKAGMLAADGSCKAFDDSANGFVPGEGAGAIILKRLDAAIRDGDHILGKIIAYGVNQDGKTNGITAPNGQSQQRLVESIYQKFQLDPGTISYVEAHGTGTRLGDPIEVNALTKAFRKYTGRKQFCGIGSVKTNIGHTTTAAGISGILKVLLALQHRKLPPTLNFRHANKLINFGESPFYVNDKLADWNPGEVPRRAAISSFGFSGTNAHLVIEEAPSLDRAEDPTADSNTHGDAGQSLILVSASSFDNLRQYARCLAEQIRADAGAGSTLENLAYTSQALRKHLSHRHGFFARTSDELLERIDGWLGDGEQPHVVSAPHVPAATSGAVDAEALEQWIARRDFEALYRAWAAGSEVDWIRLYPGTQKRKVPMPPHVFNKKRYWFDASQLLVDTQHKSANIENEVRTDAGVAPVNQINQPNFEKAGPLNMAGSNGKSVKLKLKSTRDVQHEPAARTVPSISTSTDANQPQNQEAIVAGLKRILAAILLVDAEDIAWNRNFSELGVDSIMGVEFVKGINRAFGTNLSASLIFDYPYVKDLAAHLRALLLPPAAPAAPSQPEAAVLAQLDAQGAVPGRSNQEIAEELRAILAGVLLVDAKDVAWNKNFSELGVDSIMGVEFVKGINRAFGTNLSASLIFDYPYVKDLADHIRPLLLRPQAPAEPSRPEAAVPAQAQVPVAVPGKSNQAIAEELKAILAGVLLVDAKDVAWNKNFSELGVDSIMGVEFVKGINRAFGTNLSASLIFDYPNVKDLATHIQPLLSIPASAGHLQMEVKPGVEGEAHLQGRVTRVSGRSKEETLASLQAILADVLLVDTKDVAWNRTFSEMGIDSIMGVEFVKRINGDLGVNLSASLIFDYPYLPDLAAHIHPLLLQAPVAIPAQRPTAEVPQTGERAAPIAPAPVHFGGIGGNVIRGSSFLSEVRWQPIALREPLDNEIQIDVVASAINFADILCVKGFYPAMPAYPFVSGFEVAGIVKRVGSQVRSVQVGDAVLALTGIELGGHADAVNVKDGLFVKKPDSISFSEAASLPIVFWTAYYVLVNLAQISAGDLVLIQVAAGGVGQMAVALAKKFGAKVIGTSSSEEKLAYLRSIGVEHAINYRAQDFSEQVRKISGGRGVDIVLNTLGEMIQEGLDALAPGGRYIELAVVGLRSSSKFSLAGLSNNQSFFSFDGRRFINGHPDTIRGILEQMNRYIVSGELAVPPIKEFSHLAIQEALEYLAARRNIGKVVLLHKGKDFEHKVQARQGGNSSRLPAQSQPAQSQPAQSQPAQSQPAQSQPAQSQPAQSQLSRGQQQPPNLDRRPAPQPMDIAVIGMSGRFPGAKNVDEFWHNLTRGIDSVEEVPAQRWDLNEHFHTDRSLPAKTYSKWGGYLDDVDRFDPSFFSLTPKEAELMDPQQRLFLQEAWKAVEDAGYAARDWSKKRCGVFVGASSGDYVERLRGNAQTMNSALLSGNSTSMLPARPAYFMNLKGPAVTIDTACSSSLMAVHQACISILTGECETAIAGGVSVFVTPEMHILTSKSGMLSKDGKCKTFDNSADGFVQGEAVGVVVLKPLAAALRDKDFIYGVIKASGSNQDGKSNGIMAPSSLAQSSLQAEVYRKHGIDPDDINYIEAHGTGTKLGDPIEIEALSRSLNSELRVKQGCPIGSVKTNIGHALAAAGISGLIKVLLCLRHKELVPSLHYHTANEHIRFEQTPFYVNTEHRPWNPPKRRLAAINSFGFSGTNCHLVIEEAPARETLTRTSSAAGGYHLVPFSAADELSLRGNLASLQKWLESSHADIENIASILRTGREHFEVRSVALVRSCEELHQVLAQVLSGKPLDGKFSDHYLSEAANDEDQELPRSVPPTDYRYCRVAAQWYLANKEFQWHEVFPVSEEIKVPLPTYEFLQESYWVENSHQQWQVQPALTAADKKPSTDDNRDPAATESSHEAPFCIGSGDYIVADHVINERRVVPAAAFVSSMVSRLIPDAAHGTKVSLRNIQWHRQCVIAAHEGHAELVLRRSGSRRIDIYATAGFVGADPESVRHMSAEIDTAVLAVTDLRKEFNLEGLRSRCSQKILKSNIYPTLSAMGVDYGPSFQVIEKCYFNQRESITYLEAPAGDALSAEPGVDARTWILPNLLDGALQSLYGVKSTLPDYRDLTMLPVAIESLQVFAQMPRSLIVIARLRDEAKHIDGAGLTFDLLLLDEFENPVMCIRGYQTKSVYGGGRGVKRKASLAREKDSGLHSFRTVWQTSGERAKVGSTAALAGKNLLLVGASDLFTQELARRLPETRIARVSYLIDDQDGGDCRELKSEESLFAQVEVRARDADAWSRVVEELEGRGFAANCVIFLTHLPSEITVATLDVALATNTLTQFSLFKALLKTSARENLDYLCLFATENARQPNPLVYGLNGLFKTINKENPRVRPRLVFLSRETSPAEPIEQAVSISLAELGIDYRQEESTILWEENCRLTRVLREFPLQEIKSAGLVVKGTYLITGGLGHIGRAIAERLARDYQARIALVGRREPSPSDQAFIVSLNQAGASASYFQGDVADFPRTRQLVSEVRSTLGELNGVFHTAGVLHDRYLIEKEREEFLDTLRPKVSATLALHEALRGVPLDFFALFSSAAGHTGNPAQCDYAYANSFLDGFAAWRNTRVDQKGGHFGKTLSLGWALWEAGGMYIDSDRVRSFIEQDIGMLPLSREDGVKALEKALASDECYWMLINGHSARLRASFGVVNEAWDVETTTAREPKDQQQRLEQARHGAQDSQTCCEAGALPALLAPWTQERLREETRAFLIDTLAETLKLPKRKITLNKTFDRYGIDSVVILELDRVLGRHFSELPKTLFFEYNSIEGLSNYLIDHHTPSLRELFVKTEPVVAAPPMPSEVVAGSRKPSAASDLRLPAAAAAACEPIAIVGVSGRYPKADDLDAFWKNLSAGVDCIEEIPANRWDYRQTFQAPGAGGESLSVGKTYSKWGAFINGVDEFDPLFFNISPREAEYLDPQERLFLQCAWHTIEDAGYKVSQLNSSIGVFVGVMWGQYQFFGVEESLKSPSLVSSSSYASIANRVSHYMNLSGPSLAVDSMCSSSLTAIHLACQAIRAGECEAALAGGVNVTVHPNKHIQLSQGRFAASDGRCRSFGEGGDGYVPGEGVGAVLLKPLSRALRDGDHIYAVIRGSALNHAGKTNGYTVPSPNAQAAVIRAAIDRAGVDPSSIQYVEAHGTGTALGDPIEISGLAKALPELANRPQTLPIGSVKSMIGHLESAAGIAGLTKLLLQLKHRRFVGSLHAQTLNPNIDFKKTPFFVQREPAHWPENVREFVGDAAGPVAPRRAALSSFGAGGSNAHLIIEEAPARKSATVKPGEALLPFPISARSEQRLKDYVERLTRFIEQNFSEQTSNTPENVADENDRQSGEPWQDLIGPLKAIITEAVAESLGVSASDLSLSDRLDDYGVDTMAVAQMEGAIARKLNVDVTLKRALSLLDNLRALARKEAKALRQASGRHETPLPPVAISESAHEYLNLVYTFQTAREEYAERFVVLASNLRQLHQRLKAYLDGELESDPGTFYRGNVRDDNANANLEETVLRAHRDRDARALAECWIHGAEVDWAVLYPAAKPMRIPAPGYPFARDRYWINVTSPSPLPARAGVQSRAAKRHAREGLESDYVAPRTDLQKAIAEVWQEVLGIEQVGLYDDFFALGGNSMVSMEIIARLRSRIDSEVKLGQFMEASTVFAVAQIVEQAGGSLVAAAPPSASSASKSMGLERTTPDGYSGQVIPADLSKTRFPLSLGQTRFWFLNTLNRNSPVYNLTTYVDFRGPELNVSAFEQSYQTLLQRHGALRTRFVEDREGIAQIVEAKGKSNLEWVDLRDRAVTDTEIKALTERESMQPLDFISGIGHKLVVYRISNERFGLYLKIHHIVSDAWSLGIFIQELIALYSARMADRAHTLGQTEVHFGHYSEWSAERRPQVLESQLPYWVEKLKGIAPAPTLPLDYPRPNRGIFSASHLTFHLTREKLGQLESFAKKNKASLFVTLLSAFNVVLHLFSQQEDIVVGFPVANRSNRSTENMLGFLANTLVLRTDLTGNPSVAEMIDRVKQVSYGAFDHSEVPFAKIVEAIKPKRAINFNPVFQVMFNMIPDLELLPPAEFELSLRDDPPAAIDFDLMLRITQKRDSLLGTLHYAKDLFSAATAQAYVDRFLQVLDDMVSRADARLQDLGRVNRAKDNEPAHIVVSSTFTIDPIVETLNYWSQKFEKNYKTILAPYNQVYNQLLDPSQETLSNAGGMNLMVIKFDDWTKEHNLGWDEMVSVSNRAFEDFTSGLQQAQRQLRSPLLLLIGPSDYSRLSHPEDRRALYQRYHQELADCVSELDKVTLLRSDTLAQLYGAERVFDPGMDANGHIPYSFEYFHALGTAAFRAIYGLTRKAHKVIVLDCDQTLWRGVLGEDGFDGIQVDESRKRLQRKLIEQARAGVLLCLCSKNEEQDVLRVLREHPDMELRLEHIMAHRVNWTPKPQSIVELADQLDLSTDSFIFIDDNPVECEQMRAARPEVLTLRIPERPEEIARFVDHGWYFDHYRVTQEDRARTQMMRENLARESESARFSSFADFIESLSLEVESGPVTNFIRASQLLARTNQFNFAGLRLSMEELEAFTKTPGNTALSVQVKDRFGDYGLVGCLLISETTTKGARELKLLNMVLSCRTMGKGVEHQLLRHFAHIARQRGIDRLSVEFKRTDRNKPALEFLFRLAKSARSPADVPMGELVFTTEELLDLKFDPASHINSANGSSAKVRSPGVWTNVNQRLMEIAEQGIHVTQIASELGAKKGNTPTADPPAVATKTTDMLAEIRARRMTPQMRKAILAPLPTAKRLESHRDALTNGNGSGRGRGVHSADQGGALKGDGAEATIVGVFRDIMGADHLSLTDNYFDIGVQSMDLVKICARLEEIYHREIPIELLFQYTSIRALAAYLGEPGISPQPGRPLRTAVTMQGVHQ